MELQLALALPINPTYHKKRTFSQLLMMDHAAPPESTLTDHVMLPTLSLLPLTPNHHHDDDHHSQCSNITKYVLLGPSFYLSSSFRYVNICV